MRSASRNQKGPFSSLSRWLTWRILPNQRFRLTREGRGYFLIWLTLLGIGLQQQSNLILLTAGFAAGPIVASILISGRMIRRLQVSRRTPGYVFAGETLNIDYSLENQRRHLSALALCIEDELIPADRAAAGANRIAPRVVFSRVSGRSRARLRWSGSSPTRGRYTFRTLELVTRSPFGLMERRMTLPAEDEILVYPCVGKLTRRWHQRYRESTETKRGLRYDRSSQQQEYHGLREYRAGDSPRWIHWRTTARLGQPMVKEFEQQNEQDLAVLLDPWLPRTRAQSEQREAVEEAIRFAATLCLEVCRQSGRKLTLGWTGPTYGVRQGSASVKFLHEILQELAVLRPSSEGSLHKLFDVLPPSTLRQSYLVVVTTRSLKLADEMEKSFRLASPTGRGLASRIMLLDVSRGDQADLVQYNRKSTTPSTSTTLEPVTRLDHHSAANGSNGQLDTDTSAQRLTTLAEQQSQERT